jgi:hypothetical protein
MNFSSSRHVPQAVYEPHSRAPFTCEHCRLKFFSLRNKLAHQDGYCWRRNKDKDEDWKREFNRLRGDNDHMEYESIFPDVFSSSSKGMQSLNSMDAYKNAFDHYVNKKHKYEHAIGPKNSLNSSFVKSNEINEVIKGS